jgi:tRNA(fMet)-specific endonuclease VapC
VTRRYLLDTGPAFDLLFHRRGVDRRVEDVRRQGAKIGIGMPVLAEIVAGLEASGSREMSWDIARHALGKLVCWPFDEKAAYEYGRVFSELKSLGRPMQQIDIMIAAIAFTLGNCTVISSDSDLTAVPGLKVENWAT